MQRRLIKQKPVKRNCEFCHNHTEPSYRRWEDLKKYLTERGKILGKDRDGLCSKHQRDLAVAIKRARFLAFLPFIVRN
jgi:small subunit ribosomal protein S18